MNNSMNNLYNSSEINLLTFTCFYFTLLIISKKVLKLTNMYHYYKLKLAR